MSAGIREAGLIDMPALLRMGQAFFDQAGLDTLTQWDEASFEATAQMLIASEPGILLVAEADGHGVGMAGALVFPAYFNVNVWVGQELFWFVSPQHRFGVGAALIARLEEEAKRRGASLFIAGAVAGLRDAAIARLYARRGYRPTEYSFIKAIAS
jgi:GNAT superfamily N-acetyltransferase